MIMWAAYSKRFLGLLGLLCVVLFPVIVRASGYIEERDDKTIIHVVVDRLPDPSKVDTASRADVAAVREFKRRFSEIFAERYRDKYKAHPEIYGVHNWDEVEIELHPFTSLRVEGVEVDLMAIAGGTAPDVLYVNFRKSDTYVRNRFLYPLDKPVDGYITSMSQEELDFRINKKIWPVIKRKGPDGKEGVWALPYGGALGRVLLFRKDLFDANNIPYPTAQWTWADMMSAAKTLTDPPNGTYGITGGGGKHESWFWITYLWSAGGEVMVYNAEENTWRCTFDSRQAAIALEFYNRLNFERWTDAENKPRRGYTSRNSSKANVKWERGEIGMHMAYIDERLFSTINPELTGMVPVPLGPTGIRGAELNSRMLGLFSEIKEPAVRDAAWEYLRFYDCEDAAAIKVKIMVEGGLGRFINPQLLRRFGYPEIERLAPKGWSKVFEVAIATGKPEPYGENSNIAYDQMTLPIHEAQQAALADKLPSDMEERVDYIHRLLQRACTESNERMMGVIAPRERTLRRISALLLIIGIVVTFTFVFRRIFRAFTPQDGTDRKGWQWRRYAWAYILLVPAVASILVWRYVPLLRGSTMAFFDYRIIGKSTWVGLDNFGDLLFDRFWWAAVWNSLRYSFLIIFLTFLPPIILAILLQEVPRCKVLYRTLFYLPAVIAGLVTILLWKQFYDPSDTGVLNAIVLKIPTIGFVLIGTVMLFVCCLFARRLWIHGQKWIGRLFVAAGIMIFSAVLKLPWKTMMHRIDQFGKECANRLHGESYYMAEWHAQAKSIDLLVGWLAVGALIMMLCMVARRWLLVHGRSGWSWVVGLLGGLAAVATGLAGMQCSVLDTHRIAALLSGMTIFLVGIHFAGKLWEKKQCYGGWTIAISGLLLSASAFIFAERSIGALLFETVPSFLYAFFLLPPSEAFQWLAASDTAMLSCVIPLVWAGMGPGCLIYLAALKGIPDDYYEAADIDGANVLDKILFIVFPMLKALIIINFVGVFINSWYGATGSILAMTGGGADTEVAGLHIWYKAFTYLKFGPATAAAWMLGFLLIGFTVQQLQILSRVEFRAQGMDDT